MKYRKVVCRMRVQRPWKVKIRGALMDKNGSDTIEMLLSIATISCFIILCLSIMTYVITLGQVNFEAKRVVRQIEVTGIIPDAAALTNTMANAFAASDSLSDFNVIISDAEKIGSSDKLQFCGTFNLTASCVYKIPIIVPGSFEGYTIEMPISSTVTGMSEMYHGS